MSEKFKVEVISPSKTILKLETREVIIPSYEGEMGILKDHIPLITFLRPGILSIKNDDEKKYFIEDGTVEFIDNNLLILTSTAKDISSLDRDKINLLIKEAEAEFNKDNISDKDKYILFYKIETLKSIN